MTSPDIPFERIDHFRSRLSRGEEDTTISRAHLGDAKIYIARALQENPQTAGRGYLVLQENEEHRDIRFLRLPDAREDDPLAPKRALTLLAFSALLEDQRSHTWTGDTILAFPSDEITPEQDALFKDILNVAPQQKLARGAISIAMGRLQEMLYEVQAYRAPYPYQIGPTPWLDEERSA